MCLFFCLKKWSNLLKMLWNNVFKIIQRRILMGMSYWLRMLNISSHRILMAFDSRDFRCFLFCFIMMNPRMYFAYIFYIRDFNAFWWQTFNFFIQHGLFHVPIYKQVSFLVLMLESETEMQSTTVMWRLNKKIQTLQMFTLQNHIDSGYNRDKLTCNDWGSQTCEFGVTGRGWRGWNKTLLLTVTVIVIEPNDAITISSASAVMCWELNEKMMGFFFFLHFSSIFTNKLVLGVSLDQCDSTSTTGSDNP